MFILWFLQAIHKALTKGDLEDERSDSEISDEEDIDEKKKNWARRKRFNARYFKLI